MAQFTARNGSVARPLSACSAAATSSLPVPLSPRMRMVASLRAARQIRSNSACIWGAAVTIP